jgi:hypothetical protein
MIVIYMVYSIYFLFLSRISTIVECWAGSSSELPSLDANDLNFMSVSVVVTEQLKRTITLLLSSMEERDIVLMGIR